MFFISHFDDLMSMSHSNSNFDLKLLKSLLLAEDTEFYSRVWLQRIQNKNL